MVSLGLIRDSVSEHRTTLQLLLSPKIVLASTLRPGKNLTCNFFVISNLKNIITTLE